MMPRTLSRVGVCELRESLAAIAKHRQRARRAAVKANLPRLTPKVNTPDTDWSASVSKAVGDKPKVPRIVDKNWSAELDKVSGTHYRPPQTPSAEVKKKKPAEKAGAGWDLKGKARTAAGYGLLGMGGLATLAGGSGEPAYESAGIVARCKLRENGRVREAWLHGKSDPKYATEALDVIQRASKSKDELPEPSRNTLMKQERGLPGGGAREHARDLVAKQRQFIKDRLATKENPYQQLADRAGGLRRRRWFAAKPYPKLNPPKVFSALRSVL